MTTCRDIVTRSMRMAGIMSRSENPDAAEMQDGMLVLQSLYDEWLTAGMFGRLTDVYEEGDYEASEGERVITAGTVTLPSLIDDERKPRDLVAVEIFNGTTRAVWIWDRTAWVQTNALVESDDAPLASRGMNGLAACLAQVFCAEFGAPLTSAIMMQAAAFRSALAYKFGSERNVPEGSWY